MIKIIRENGNFDMKKDESEEIELDLSELNNRTLWMLDAYLKEHRVQPTTESGVVVNKVCEFFKISILNNIPHSLGVYF